MQLTQSEDYILQSAMSLLNAQQAILAEVPKAKEQAAKKFQQQETNEAMRQRIWDSVLFYNFLQVAMDGMRRRCDGYNFTFQNKKQRKRQVVINCDNIWHYQAIPLQREQDNKQ